jgi:hypothetical protein
MNAVPQNVLQKLFRSWETVHPYNAAQAVKLRGAPDEGTVVGAWEAALAALQLGPTRINGDAPSHLDFTSRFTFRVSELLPRRGKPLPATSASSARPSVHHLAGLTSSNGAATTLLTPLVSLQEHLSSELNRPFAEYVDGWPFRPFLLRDGENSWIGLSYRHCVADSVSIRMVLREWLGRLGCPSQPVRGPLTHIDESYWKLFAARDSRVRLNQTLSTFIRGHQRLRSAQKPMTSGKRDYPVRVVLGEAPEGMITELRRECRSRELRVSDVMLTALLKSARSHVPLQLRHNRRDVAVGCIVNLRPYARRDLADAFGLYLGFTSIVCSPKDFASKSGLLEEVQKQTAMHRHLGIGPACTVWVNAGLTLGRFMPKPRLYHFYRKSMPLAAGLSSVSMRRDDSLGPEVLDYVRISPTGPIAPAVLSTTEMNGRLSLALTYRPSVLSEQSARLMLDDFVAALRIS